MKSLHTIIILFLLIVKVSAQEIKRVNTRDLVPIAKTYGIDSALIVSGGFPIYIIDTLTAIKLLDFVDDYERYSQTENFFNNMAHNWETQFLSKKTLELSNRVTEKIKNGSIDKYGNLIVLDDKLIISIIKQKPDSIETLLIDCYGICSKIADSLKTKFPLGLYRFFYSFKNGTHPTVDAFEDCNMNCYKIMWTLRQLNSRYYVLKKLEYHNSQLRRWQQNPDILRFEDLYHEYDSKVLTLSNQYDSISVIDFENEPELRKITSEYGTIDKCWKHLLTYKNQGFFEMGCQFATLSGHGIIYKLELIDKNKLKITITQAWIS